MIQSILYIYTYVYITNYIKNLKDTLFVVPPKYP